MKALTEKPGIDPLTNKNVNDQSISHNHAFRPVIQGWKDCQRNKIKRSRPNSNLENGIIYGNHASGKGQALSISHL